MNIRYLYVLSTFTRYIGENHSHLWLFNFDKMLISYDARGILGIIDKLVKINGFWSFKTENGTFALRRRGDLDCVEVNKTIDKMYYKWKNERKLK